MRWRNAGSTAAPARFMRWRRSAAGRHPSHHQRRLRRHDTGCGDWADGTQVGEPLYLRESVRGVAVHGNVIVTAAGADIAIHQPAFPATDALAAVPFPEQRSVGERSDNGLLSGTTAGMCPVITRAVVGCCARLGHVIRYIGRAGAMEGEGQRRCEVGCQHYPGRHSPSVPGHESGNHLRSGPVLAGGLVGVDLLRDALVGVAEPIGDDLAIDA